jgi:HAD superfamily hydrolase (TIGR01509 family)
MTIKCITFDLDDTMWSIYPIIARAEGRFLEWLSIQLPTIANQLTSEELSIHRNTYFKRYPELHHDLSLLRKSWMASLMQEYGHEEKLVENHVEEGFAIFCKERNNLTLFDNVETVLEKLKTQYRTGAVTNGNANLKTIGIDHHFDFYLTSAQIGYSKPHPIMFKATATSAQCRPEEILHIGDDPIRDVEGAALAGFKTVWFNLHEKTWQGPIEPDAIVEGWEELPDVVARLNSIN